ncbi:MAG: TIGR01212 family radical SAM protein [Planctomycetota bacterium]
MTSSVALLARQTAQPFATAPKVERGPWGFRSYRQHLAARFPGQHIRKLCLDAGFSCPNLDGSKGRSGCAYCNNAGFVPRGRELPSLAEQWAAGCAALERRHRRVDGFIAYFQAFSNTHASVAHLRRLLEPFPAGFPRCAGISISTRPDCLEDAVIDHLAAVGRRTFLTLEIGLQSDRDEVLEAVGRGHDRACFLDAITRCAGRGFELCAHFMLGLPGEGEDAPERMGALAASLPVQSVKLHNLHIMRDTPLEAAFRAGELGCPDSVRYCAMAARFIARLRPDQAVQRVLADAPDAVLMSDPWCHDKQRFLNNLKAQLEQV